MLRFFKDLPYFASERTRSIKRYLALLLGLGLLATGCRNTPGYVYDIFTEMHYSQSYRVQEPPRLLPPSRSIPITGKEVAYNFAEAANLKNPVQKNQATMDRAAKLFSVNCSICHGVNADGESFVATKFKDAGVGPPIAFNSDRIRARKEGELFWVLSNGLGNMPSFGKLLTAEERWSLVRFVRTKAGSE